MLGAWQCRRGCGALFRVPRRSLSSRALVSLTRRPAAIVWIFSCLFSFSPVNMCFQYPSEPGSWGLLLLSPVLILFPCRLRAWLGLSPPVTGSPIPSCHLRGKPHWEGEVDGKFCFSESSSRLWSSFLPSCEVQMMFFIPAKGDVGSCPAGAAVTVL